MQSTSKSFTIRTPVVPCYSLIKYFVFIQKLFIHFNDIQFVMRFSRIFHVLVIFNVTWSQLLNDEDDWTRKVSRFIGELVSDVILKDPEGIQDVVFLRIESEHKSELLDQITSEMSSKVLWAVDCFKPIEYEIRQPISMVIIVTDYTKGVNFHSLKFFSILMVVFSFCLDQSYSADSESLWRSLRGHDS